MLDASDSDVRFEGVKRKCDDGVNLGGCCAVGDVMVSCDVVARWRRSGLEDMLWSDAVPGATKREVVDACGPAETNH